MGDVIIDLPWLLLVKICCISSTFPCVGHSEKLTFSMEKCPKEYYLSVCSMYVHHVHHVLVPTKLVADT